MTCCAKYTQFGLCLGVCGSVYPAGVIILLDIAFDFYYLIFRTIWILFAHKHGRFHKKNYASFMPVHM